VSRGFYQQEGEDYDKTLTPVIEEIVLVFMKISSFVLMLLRFQPCAEDFQLCVDVVVMPA
jgi:hypothetical protein